MNVAKQYSNDLHKKRQKTMSLTEEVQKTMAIDSKLIEAFLTQKDVAPWFRGTSIFHLEGANMLLNALRDDTEQRTTHRVRSCLNLIGLQPAITSKQITFLMRLSRGNDLAFLWFLMEMHYKTPKPGAYSINEQLICSAICHLDTITTLRELDKILPRSHTSTSTMGKAGAKPKQMKEYDGKNIPKKTKPTYILPYFEKIPRSEPYGKPLTLKVPNFKVHFDIYGPYSDPNHVVYNESNRWYAHYNMNPGRRIAFRIIRETIENLFENYEAASLRANTIDVLCDYHKTIKQMEEKRKHELRVKARDECWKRYFGTGDVKAERAKHIKELLDKSVEQQLCKFRKQANTIRKESTLKTITSDCDIYDILLGDELNESCRLKPEFIDTGIRAQKETKLRKKTENDGEKNNNVYDKNNKKHDVDTRDGPKNLENGTTQPPRVCRDGCGNSFNSTDKLTSVQSYTHRPKRCVLKNSDCNSKLASHISEFGERYMRNYDYSHVRETTTPSQTFFHRPKEHAPYKFDYRKIFATKPKDDDKTRIKKAFLEALDEDISNLEANRNIDETVSECANNIFEKELQKYEKEKNAAIAAQLTEEERPLSQYANLASYNCEDRVLMDQMLFDAFEYLRKNPKFVWAQLPDAHKVPMLREWIAQRFGKEYSPKERANAYRLSSEIFRALEKINYKFPMPNANQMGKNLFVNYNCRNYLNKKRKHIKDKYYRRLDAALLEHTRIFWFAMRAYVCSNGPPRKTLFAYMPSCCRDIQHFRIWKSSEYRNCKGAWDARQIEKRREQVNK